MKRAQAYTVGSAGVAALVLILGSAAWACTAFTSLTGPEAGVAESQVTMHGTNLTGSSSKSGTVELRWNGLPGQVLGEAPADDAGNVTIPITIPQVAPGIYYIVALVDGHGIARSVFEVMPPAGTAAPSASSLGALPLSGGHLGHNAGPSGPGLEFGAVLLAIGLVVLVGGYGAVVAAHRRTVPSAD